MKTINQTLFRLVRLRLVDNCRLVGLVRGFLVSLAIEVLTILSLLVLTLWRSITKITIKKQKWHFSAKKILNKANPSLIIGANYKRLKILIIQDQQNYKISTNKVHMETIMRERIWIKIWMIIRWMKSRKIHFIISKWIQIS